MKEAIRLVVVLVLAVVPVFTWNNGLAKLPPMGWMSWTKYACNLDCTNFPHGCIDERLYREMIDNIVDQGYSKLGYNYVNIDDCWSELTRDNRTKRLVPDKKRFPNGILTLSKYAHSRGIKFGIYSDVGTKTCGGYPGVRGENGEDYTKLDAQTFAEWEIDSLKLDGCYAQERDYNRTYPEYTRALARYGICLDARKSFHFL